MSGRISVVIPARDAAATVAAAVAAVAGQPEVAEVLVVDDGSVDGTGAAAAAAGARVERLEPGRGPASARNHGAAAAATGLILFLDADVVAAPGLAAAVAAHFEAPAVDGVQGIYAPSAPGDSWPTRFQNDYYHHVFAGLGSGPAAVAATFCFAVRREVLLAAGGFETAVTGPTVEDEALGYRLTRAGRRIVLDPALQVRHLARYGWTAMLARKLRMARSQGKMLLRRGERPGPGLRTHHPRFMLVGVPATAAALVLALAVPLGPLRWPAVVALLAVTAAGAWPFWRFLTRGRPAALPLAAALTLVDNLAIAAGLALGLVEGLAGRRY